MSKIEMVKNLDSSSPQILLVETVRKLETQLSRLTPALEQEATRLLAELAELVGRWEERIQAQREAQAAATQRLELIEATIGRREKALRQLLAQAEKSVAAATKAAAAATKATSQQAPPWWMPLVLATLGGLIAGVTMIIGGIVFSG